MQNSCTYFLQFHFRMKPCKISAKKVSQVMYLILTQCSFFRLWTFLHNLLASGRWAFCVEFCIFNINIAKLRNVKLKFGSHTWKPCHPQKICVQYATIKFCLSLNLLLFILNTVVLLVCFLFYQSSYQWNFVSLHLFG